MTVQLKEVPALQGLHWVKTGLQLGVSQPFGFVSMLGLMLTVALLLMLLPLVGAIALMMLMPVFWLMFMLATQQANQGQRVNPWQLIQTLRQSLNNGAQPRHWLVLGALYTGMTFLVMLVAGLLGPDMEALGQAIEQASESSNPEALQDPVLVQSLLWRLGLSFPVSLAFWHTPALLYWGATTPVKAVFFSAVVCWRNLGAFALYAIGWATVGLSFLLLIELLAQLMGPSIVTQMLSISAGLWVVSAFYASLYSTVSDCLQFEKSDAEQQV